MVKEIVRDPVFLAIKSAQAESADITTAMDLLDTLKANSERCVGMAANMIGVSKRIIAINDEGTYYIMINPVILKKTARYTAEEGCLSLSGVRKTERYAVIRVSFTDEQGRVRQKSFTGFAAQIIQHEMDHCDGILI